VEFRPLEGDPVAFEYAFVHSYSWHRQGGGADCPCSFTITLTSGEKIKVGGACLKELYERLKRHLVFEVWAMERNPLAEKVLPAEEALVYRIEIQKPKQEQGA
jgi:hypothetical protein